MSWKFRPPIRRPILLSLHQPLGRRAEAEAAVQLVGVARMEEPLPVGPRASLHHLAHELDAEPAAAELGEHVDVREVDRGDAVGKRAGEADLAAAGVEADDAARLPDRPLDGLALPALRPVRVD